MVDKMPFSDFIKFLKSAYMLECQEGLANVQQSNFSSFTEKVREQISSDLKDGSRHYLVKKILDYKEVVANLARKMRGG